MLPRVLLRALRTGSALHVGHSHTCASNAELFLPVIVRRITYRKSSAEQQDARHAEVEQDEPGHFRSRTQRRRTNTPYWYLLQCKKLLKSDKLWEALDLFEVRMLKEERLQPEEYNYTVLMGGCGRAGYVKKAFQLYNDMKKRGLEPSGAAYTALFNACAQSPWKQSGLEQALKLRQELRRKNVPLNPVTQHALLKVLARAGDLKACFQVLREMLQNGQAVTPETFHYFLMCCVEDKEQGFRLALQVWHQMLSSGIKPDAQNYDILLRAARDCGIGDPALATKLLLRGRDESGPNRERGRRSKPRELLDADVFERRVLTDAMSLEAELIPASSPSPAPVQTSVPNLLDPGSCGSGVVALATASGPSDRLALIGDLDGFLNKMSSDGLQPSIKTLTLLADVAEPGSQSVRSLIRAADQGGVKLDTGFFNTLIRRAAKAGDVEGAKAVKALMLERKLSVNPQTFCSMALTCRTHHDGLQLLTDMKTYGVTPNAHVFSALIGQAVRRLDYAWLHQLLIQMHQMRVSPNDVIIKQLEFAAAYPPTYNQYKSKNTYLEKIGGFRGFYKQWLEFMPAQETPHPWENHQPLRTENERDGVESSHEAGEPRQCR